MSKLDEKIFLNMAKKIYINPKKEVINILKEEYINLEKRLNELKKINIEGIEPLVRINNPIIYLREDTIDEEDILDKKIALNNSTNHNDDYVIIKKVLK